MNTSDVPLKAWMRVVAEAAAIVLSILLAFWIDASWDRRGNRIEAFEVLVGLQREFAGYGERLTREVSIGEGLDPIFTMVLASGPPDFAVPPPPDTIDRVLFWTGVSGTVDAEGGTLAALLTSGRLELIENPELRERLAAWPSVMQDIRDNELLIRQYGLAVSSTLVDHRISWSRAWAAGGRSWPVRLPDDVQVEEGYAELLRDPAFANVLAWRYGMLRNSWGEYRSAAAQAASIQTLVEAELAARH